LHLKKTSGSYKGGQWSGACPFCNEGRDRFQLWPYDAKPGYWCRICHESGSLNWLFKKFGMSDILAQVVKAQEPEKLVLTNHIDPAIVEECYVRSRDLVYKYYGGFGISPDILDEYRVGYYQKGSWRGFLIPHEVWVQDGLIYEFGAGIRKDDEVAPASMGKWMSVSGSKNSGFYTTKFVTLPGIRPGKQIDYLLICEAEKDAMTLLSAGLNATAFHPSGFWLENLRPALSNVIFPVIVQDDDGGRGFERANLIQKHMGRKIIRVATPDHKQPSDLARDKGIEAVKEWAKENCPWI
jgi:hypothetical protein